MLRRTPEEILRIIKVKTNLGFDFRVSRYRYRDQQLREICKRLRKKGLVRIKYERDVMVITPKEIES
jgi:hypothetical protein